MKRLAFFLILAVLVVPQAAAGPWHKSLASAQKVAKEKNQHIFVDLFANWCGWCHRMEKEVFPSEAFQNATDDMVLLRVNTEDGGEGQKMSLDYQVSSLPTFLILTPDMTIVGVIRGYAPAADFAKIVTTTEAKYADFLKRVKNEATIAKDYPKRLDLAREFIARHAFARAESRLKRLQTEAGVPPAIRDQAYYELATSQMLQKKHEEALKTIGKLTSISKSGDPVERARVLSGQLLAMQGNLLGAANEFRSFKASFPNSPHIKTVDMILPDIERRLQRQ